MNNDRGDTEVVIEVAEMVMEENGGGWKRKKKEEAEKEEDEEDEGAPANIFHSDNCFPIRR